MRKNLRRALVLALLVVGAASMTALALPGFSDQNVSAGNLNPTDRVLVQKIKVTGDSAHAATITSVTVQNLGTAGSGQIVRIELRDGAVELGSTTNMAGLASGIIVSLTTPLNVPKSAIRYIEVFVTVGPTVSGGETVALRVKSHYVRDESTHSSPWISDLSTETIRKGGFDQITDSPPDAGYLNPTDNAIVQTSVFTDNDANGNNVLWEVQTGSGTIVKVENLGTATTADIDRIKVTLTIAGAPYTTADTTPASWLAWDPNAGTAVMEFGYSQFTGSALPTSISNNSSMSVKVEILLKSDATVTDGRTIRTKTTVLVKEGAGGSEVSYVQSMTSGTTQTIRKQGFESISDESTTVSSGTKATGESLEQIVRVTDSDINTKNIRILEIKMQNLGTATGAEIHRIRAMIGATTIFDLVRPTDAAAINSLKTGYTVVLPNPTLAAQLVADNGNAVIKIYYEIGTPVDGHTLRPAVQVKAREAGTGGTLYWSDEATYPDSVELFQPGFETVENMTPPEGGTAYSGQRLLAQKIRVADRDENTDNVTIHPIVVKNVGTAQGNPDVTKIQVYRRNTEAGEELLLGETTDLAGLRTSGSRIDVLQDNAVIDASPYAEAFLFVYLTIAEPEVMVAGRTIQLETRVLHTETQVGYDKMVTSNQWTLATNHRPVPNFTHAVTSATTSIRPKADYSTTDTIQFTGTATDPDGDAIASWHWNFGDGNTATVQNPTHRYTTGGTFTVTLTVTDARGVTGTVSKTIEVEGPPNVAPVIDAINADPENPAEDQAVAFTATITDSDQPTGTAFTYAWDFGDGTTSASATPSHAFADKQSYTVTLTVTDAQAATATKTKTILVGNAKPVAAFTASTTTPSTGDAVQFTDTSTDADDPADTPFTYAWDFDDGATSTAENPSHTYTTPGTYTVTLIVTDSRGAVSDETTTDITVSGPAQVVLYGFPNPASAAATINYFLPTGATAPELWIFNLSGKQILRQTLAAGDTQFEWDLRNEGGTAVSNGLYFCMITATSAADRTITSVVFQLLVAR